uniref:Bro-N domain-containing protein n=1 Tax=viral metagenome TaxID=1070528 RepID=A0A6C0LNZ0_9ZZZZ
MENNNVYQEEITLANKIKDKYECDIIINNEPPYTLYCANDIGKILNIPSIRSITRNLEKKYINKKTKGGIQKITYIPYKSLLKLLTKSRKNSCMEFAKYINLDIISKYCLSIETDIISCILKTFDGHVMIPQYKVDNYRIDLFFPEYKLAIECDEQHHLRKNNIEADRIRQSNIFMNLRCNFIRFNPYEKDFDLFKLLNEIYIYITVCPRKRIPQYYYSDGMLISQI